MVLMSTQGVNKDKTLVLRVYVGVRVLPLPSSFRSTYDFFSFLLWIQCLGVLVLWCFGYFLCHLLGLLVSVQSTGLASRFSTTCDSVLL